MFEDMLKTIREHNNDISLENIVNEISDKILEGTHLMNNAVHPEQWDLGASMWFVSHCMMFSYRWHQ